MTNTIITIGREFGSGGCEIGHKLAEKLGIKCYDKDMLDLAAKESGICPVSYTHLLPLLTTLQAVQKSLQR